VLPLRENEVVFDVRDRPAERAAPVAWIQDLVDKDQQRGASLAHCNFAVSLKAHFFEKISA